MTVPTTNLGKTGLTVSRFVLGTMTFGLQTDEETARVILDTSADAGINFLDTADVYPLGGGIATAGRTEEIIGRWLKGKREHFILLYIPRENTVTLKSTHSSMLRTIEPPEM
jgi:1-deoxyxylulose-5-phosphate synthase